MAKIEQGLTIEDMRNYTENIVDLMYLVDWLNRRPETIQTLNWAEDSGTKPVAVGLNGLRPDGAELPSYEGIDRV